MTALSGRLKRFKPSPFVAAARRVAELTAQGRQIVNLNTGEPIASGTRIVRAHQTIFHDAEHPSRLVLPVIPR